MSALFVFDDPYGHVQLWWDGGNNPSFSGFCFGAWEEIFGLPGWESIALSILIANELPTESIRTLEKAYEFSLKVQDYLALAHERGTSDADYYSWADGLNSVEQAEKYFRNYQQRFSDLKIKRECTKRRRAEFNSGRDRLVLLLLDAGVSYLCAEPDCRAHTDLTVDHKKPLSRGGSDDVENLQFLCRSHNSQKGDRG